MTNMLGLRSPYLERLKSLSAPVCPSALVRWCAVTRHPFEQRVGPKGIASPRTKLAMPYESSRAQTKETSRVEKEFWALRLIDPQLADDLINDQSINWRARGRGCGWTAIALSVCPLVID